MDYDVNWAMWHFNDFKNRRSGPNRVEVIEISFIGLRIALSDKSYDGFIRLIVVKQSFASFPADGQRCYRAGIGDDISIRQNSNNVWYR